MPEYAVTISQAFYREHHVAASSKAEARRIVKALIEKNEHDPRIIESWDASDPGPERIVAVDRIIWRGAAEDDHADAPEGSTHTPLEQGMTFGTDGREIHYRKPDPDETP